MDVLRLMQYIQIYAKEDRVLVQKLADLIGRLKQPDQALQIYEKLLDERDLAKSLRLSLLEGAVTWATAAGKQGSAGKWSQQILMLQEPTKAKIN
jgi:DNA integrity scanning protein DisA with diadenylate cyclase activity